MGISGLKAIVAGVKALGLESEEEIKDELYNRVKIRNYIPPPVAEEYRTALYEVYQKMVEEEEE